MVLAATPNQHSSGQRQACSTSTIENESMALMQCPSVLSAPTLMGHFHTLNAIVQPGQRVHSTFNLLRIFIADDFNYLR